MTTQHPRRDGKKPGKTEDELDIIYLAEERRKLRKVVRVLLDAYWGHGDGHEAPEFIQRAAALSGWKAPAYSLKGLNKGK